MINTPSPLPEYSLADLVLLLRASEHSAYLGESVSQLQHATQCAALAEEAGADEELIAASLLHDIGHIAVAGTSKMGQGALGTVDHEALGGEVLRSAGFPPRVCRLVALHVAAKRYLVTRRPAYREGLSPASIGTLAEQGGPMSEAEALAFEQDPCADDAIRLRHFDEGAKDPTKVTPPLEHFLPRLERLIAANAPR